MQESWFSTRVPDPFLRDSDSLPGLRLKNEKVCPCSDFETVESVILFTFHHFLFFYFRAALEQRAGGSQNITSSQLP